MFTIEMLPAALGDSLWIEYGEPDRPRRILIDGGLAGTADAIRAKIDAVAAAEGGTCRLELMVVTHIDGDHIEGMIKLLGQRDLPLDVGDLWYNGRDHLLAPAGEDRDAFLSAKQGEFMSRLIEMRGYAWNRAFARGTVVVPPDRADLLPVRELDGGMRLTLVSPRVEELAQLAEDWDDALAEAGIDRGDEQQILDELQRNRARPDDEFLSVPPLDVGELVKTEPGRDSSPANGASIAFVAEYGGASVLLTGDAWTSVLADGVGRLLAERGADRLPLTALKVPHHGSKNNLSIELLKQLDTRRYLISTDGSRFKHPDRPAIAWMLAGEQRTGDDTPVDLHFNYRRDPNRVWDDDELRSEWNYCTLFPQGDQGGLVVDIAGLASQRPASSMERCEETSG
jgi:beta-lactamase superfamily II metal-dependent hydrolase